MHVEPALHDMLPLGPSVMAQLACSLQSMLQDSPQAPLHVARAPHASVQLAPQVCVVTPQLPLGGHAQLVPVHVGGFAVTPPHAIVATASRIDKLQIRVMRVRCRGDAGIRQRRTTVLG